jgi:hypothetical protein
MASSAWAKARALKQHVANLCECGRPADKESGGRRGMCQNHYRRWRRYGDARYDVPIGLHWIGLAPVDRFLLRVEKTATCWIWKGAHSAKGVSDYGHLPVAGKTVMAHRWSYEHFVGRIPAGLTIDHLCRNTLCVNPDHLEPVSQRENTLRGTSPSAINSTKTHCPEGHVYDADNTRVYRGSRYCRRCHNLTTWKRRGVYCECGHGPLAHVKQGGCEGLQDGGPCWCQKAAQ